MLYQEDTFQQALPSNAQKEDVVCLSHLRWNFVYQHPQYLMSHCSTQRRVFFVEEPVIDRQKPYLDVQIHKLGTNHKGRVWVVVPHLPAGLSQDQRHNALCILMDALFLEYEIRTYLLWYYTPEALLYTRLLKPQAIVYDCMNELSMFKGANPQLSLLEAELLEKADVVFTDGYSLYQAKQSQHPNIQCFPSSFDMKHFKQARHV